MDDDLTSRLARHSPPVGSQPDVAAIRARALQRRRRRRTATAIVSAMVVVAGALALRADGDGESLETAEAVTSSTESSTPIHATDAGLGQEPYVTSSPPPGGDRPTTSTVGSPSSDTIGSSVPPSSPTTATTVPRGSYDVVTVLPAWRESRGYPFVPSPPYQLMGDPFADHGDDVLDASGCVWVLAEDGTVLTILWPPGWTARLFGGDGQPDIIEIRNELGQIVVTNRSAIGIVGGPTDQPVSHCRVSATTYEVIAGNQLDE